MLRTITDNKRCDLIRIVHGISLTHVHLCRGFALGMRSVFVSDCSRKLRPTAKHHEDQTAPFFAIAEQRLEKIASS